MLIVAWTAGCEAGWAARKAPSFSQSGWPVSGSGRRRRSSSRKSSGVRVAKEGLLVPRMSVASAIPGGA